MPDDQKSQHCTQIFGRYLNYIYGLSKQFHFTRSAKVKLDGKDYFSRQYKSNRFDLQLENLDDIWPTIHISFEIALFVLLELVQEQI